MSLITQDMLPGMGTDLLTTEREILWGPIQTWQIVGIKIAAAARDAGNDPTTILRRGLVVGRVTSSGEYRQYLPTNTDGSQVPIGFLFRDVNVLDNDGGATTKLGAMVIGGLAKTSQLIGFDDEVRRTLNNRFIFDDRLIGSPGDYPVVIARTADLTLTVADNNTLFTNQGATGAVNFTLPACAVGLRYRFLCEANQNLTVTAPAGTLVAFNNAAATSVALSTANQRIGGSFEVVANADGTKWLVVPGLASITQTVTVA